MSFPTGANERERERRKAQGFAGQKHNAKKRTVIIDHHFDDCGEDPSSLKGAFLSHQWATPLFDEGECPWATARAMKQPKASH